MDRPSDPSRSPQVDVALPLPIDSTFTYALDGDPPEPGTRVLVPFRRKEHVGWVTGPAPRRRPRVRPVLEVIDRVPSVPADLMRLCRWMADYYLAPLGLCLRAVTPSVMSEASRDYIVRTGADAGEANRTERERRLLTELAGGEAKRVSALRRALGGRSVWPEIRALHRDGLIEHEVVPPRAPAPMTRRVVVARDWLQDLAARDVLFARARRQREAFEALVAAGGRLPLEHFTRVLGMSRSVVGGLEGKGLIEVVDEELHRDPFQGEPPSAPGHRPTRDQAAAVAALVTALDDDRRSPFLLHGVTGSGKTLVYVELLRRVLERGRSAIVLVPEIALTPQTVSRFRAHFGDDVAVLHSGLSVGERYDAWRAMASGRRRVAVGARSALFAPVADLGAVVVDEEHDGSYKQSDAPRYHARDLAIVRAADSGAVCVLGSATPSLESWSNASKGKFTLLTLPDRVGGGALPSVRVVDLRALRRAAESPPARRSSGPDRSPFATLSPDLEDAITQRLERGEQTILLLNRRGYSSFVQCGECGDVSVCVRCSVSLTFHRGRRVLMCHHCRHEEAPPRRCGRCGSEDLLFRGLGTEQVERVVGETFPTARIARMDVDTTSRKWAHHEILGRVERGEVDILLGTQMIAKGLDFPRVTLVGVVNADVGIHLPDFRASERTFQLLSQVSGRAGRSDLGGEVLIQTSLPGHHAVRAAVEHDYEGFARRELELRGAPRYPPYVRLANVVVSSPRAEAAANVADDAVRWVRRWLGQRGSVELLGPAPCPIERLHGRWRFHFLLKAASARDLTDVGRAFLEGFSPGTQDVRVAFDRDPTALL